MESDKVISDEQSDNTLQTMNRLKEYFRNNLWKGRLTLALIVFITLLLIARLVLAPSIIYGATSYLKDNGIDSTIEDIDIDIFDGSISLINATGNAAGNPLFSIGLIEIHWSWTPLSEKTVAVDRIELDNIKIDIEQYSDEIIIGGVHLPLTAGGTDEASIEKNAEISVEKKAKPWALSLGEVIFSNIDICYLQDTATAAAATSESRYIDYCVDLKEMTWGGTISYATDPELDASEDIPLSSTGNFRLNGLTVIDNRLGKQLLNSSANTLNDVTISGLNNIRIRELEMNALSALHRDDEEHKDAVRFSQLSLEDINLSGLDTLSIKSIIMDDPGLFIVKQNTSDWEYEQWLPIMPESEVEARPEATDNTESSPFHIRLSAITLNRSDFCYLDNQLDNYDCFTQQRLGWSGDIKLTTGNELKLSVIGDLTAENTLVYNPKLERNLLAIETVSLAELNVKKTDALSLGNLAVHKFSALQRGEQTSDNTISFDKLTINKTAFENNKADIESIALTGLTSQVTKNKDGSFEHEKWLSSNNKQNDDKTETADEDTTADKPVFITIKQTTINTEQDILFIDHSTEPTMEVGLDKLAVEVNNINSENTDSQVSFDLSGKTTRHSTIDIAGTARPFADKISLDAKGKLKGFDLRAATPATKKAIGHIIKSGQLDADLTLLANEGVLDSNVALSLYHFNIKAESKKDAEKLDEQFGMPLNQTLVLLRDKDDSIHLDIPITGDINNPDFNPMDAIVKATSKAATVTLITFYTPYGLAYAGGNVLFDLATALDFAPILFSPGSSDIESVDSTPLDNMAKMMSEKPQIHLTLCGVTNLDDVYSLYPDMRPKTGQDKTEPDKPIQLNEEQKLKLKTLAQERQAGSKKLLIEKYNIEHSRLILCEPEHNDDSDAIAGVEINI